MNSCFPTALPAFGQTFDFCQYNGCEVASKYLAFPSVRVEIFMFIGHSGFLFSELPIYIFGLSLYGFYLFLKSFSSFYIVDTKTFYYFC